MRKRLQYGALAALVVGALALTGCGLDNPFHPSGGTTQTQQTTVIIGSSPAPAASPSVPPGGTIVPPGAVALVKLVQFGEDCPSGVQPSGADRSVRVGCEKHLTCTPFLSDGRDAVEAYPQLQPDYLRQESGFAFATGTAGGGGGYNLDARGLAPGVARYACSVNGVASAPFDLTVTQ